MSVSAKRRKSLPIVIGIVFLLLLAKFTIPAQWFGLPLGYDAGMYRYLFLAYAKGLPPFLWPALPAWATEHPVGLFMFTTPLLRAGLPVDWLIGWMWDLFPVLLAGVLAWVTGKRHGIIVGIGTLIAALLSVAYYDGYAAMYWKTYAALLWMVLTFFFVERKSFWALPCILLTLVTHHQTGLLFGLALATYWLRILPSHWRDARWRWGTLAILVVAGLSVLLYLPLWEKAVYGPLRGLFFLRGDSAPGGSFPPLQFYVSTGGILLVLGLYGFVLNLRKERGTLWQFSVLWAAIFVLFRLVFYRRFILQLDFFLLPFVGIALAQLWHQLRSWLLRGVLIIVLLIQMGFTVWVITQRLPSVSLHTYQVVRALPALVPPGTTVLDLENLSAWFVRGFLPEHQVGAPGLLDWPDWTIETWEKFIITSSHAEFAEMLKAMPQPLVLFASPDFHGYYGAAARRFVDDPCMEILSDWVYRNVCTANPTP